MANHSSAIEFYLERYRQGDRDTAFHGLLELDHSALPELTQAFRTTTETSTRAFLLKVIWQHRQPSEIALLAEALFESEPEIWQEAMDGLVTFACTESLQALRRARKRPFSDDHDAQKFSKWLEEAIGQAESQVTF